MFWRSLSILLFTLCACGPAQRVVEVECDNPSLYYPDVNGDGWADSTTEVYFGCRPPAGWVTLALPTSSNTDTASTGGTQTPTATGGTGASHTGAPTDTGTGSGSTGWGGTGSTSTGTGGTG